jgi:hypothetical protein
MGVEYLLMRLYEGGRPRPKHLTVQRGVRGHLVVREEHDADRQRMVRVARLEVAAAFKTQAPPPLYDVMLLGCTSEWISLTGFERVIAGSLSDVTSFAQSWWLTPAPLEDLLAAERRVNELSELLYLNAGRPVDATGAPGRHSPP